MPDSPEEVRYQDETFIESVASPRTFLLEGQAGFLENWRAMFAGFATLHAESVHLRSPRDGELGNGVDE